MSGNYLCIHGHFYQPPRENPWLEFIEYQPSAFPYHDWNERVTRECYGPNTRARLEADAGRILKLVNNYAYMSFDFGPTLLSWLEKVHPWIYQEILAADLASRKRYHGHGNAMAQVYNHIIMPLATTRDKLTQIRWGLTDFAYRFGRPAEGMWLAETAVDLETLALMVQEGIRFTVLAPTQAAAVRSLGDPTGAWKDVSEGIIDTRQAYRVFPRGRDFPAIDIFFFNKELSKAVAYEKVLTSGNGFLARLDTSVPREKNEACLINVATDGESYGHHFKFGDMALAWIFDHLDQAGTLKLANYAWFLEQFPPKKEVRIRDNTSWSCVHGVERWRSDCGCNVGHREGWTQAWRGPLREAMDRLSEELLNIFEEQGGRIFKDPWAARDDYISILLDVSPGSRGRFLERHAIRKALDEEERVWALELLESQRMALYMYTSCGWFFDDISGLEASQVLMYADRAMNLVEKWTKLNMKKRFLTIISRAKSNVPDFGDGADVFEKRVKKGRMSSERIAGNYAAECVVRGQHDPEGLFSRYVFPVRGLEFNAGDGAGEVTGEVLVKDLMTGRSKEVLFSARVDGPGDFQCRVSEEGETDGSYTLPDLTVDTQKTFMQGIGAGILSQVTQPLEKQEEGLLAYMSYHIGGIERPLPYGLEETLRLLLRTRFLRLAEDVENRTGERDGIRKLIRAAGPWECDISLDALETRETGKKVVRALMDRMEDASETGRVTALIEFLDMADELSLHLDLWECQNRYWDLSMEPGFPERLPMEEAKAFKELGERLGFSKEQ